MKKKTRKKSKKKQWRLPFKLTKRRVVKIISLKVAILLAFVVWLFWGLPLPNQINDQDIVSTKIFDRKGQLIYEIFADVRRTPVELEGIPKHLIQATIAIEDKNFYDHHGFDLRGIVRGISRGFTRGYAQGGSTLTQQLVKNTLLSPERTVRRKAREFVLALLVETRFTKDEILEMYLNQIPYGSTAYGIEAASELYFNKPTRDLTLAEAALLAGLPAAPSRYSPFGSRPESAITRQHIVLDRMVEEGFIGSQQADEAKNATLTFGEPEPLNAPHFALWIKEQLAEKYGDAVVEKGGLRVTTTLDLELQNFAQIAVAEEVEKLASRGVGNGAAMVVRPGSGEILAMVGSKDYFAEDEDGKVNIIFSLRQPGSSIKPLNYVYGLQNKLITASTPLADIPTCFNVLGQQSYCPVNYDGQFHGAVQTRFALGNSYNIPAVRVLAVNGIKEFIEFATDMGISTFTDPAQYGLSLTLGGGEVTPYDMTRAFSTLANQGERVPLVAFLEISDWKGNKLFERNTSEIESVRVLDPEPAFIVSHILLDNNAREQAFGSRSFLNVAGHPEVSVKTGTTNDLRDNWTVGYTGQAVALTWVGNNDNSPMSGAISGVSGASPIWNRIMKEVLDKSEQGFYNPDDTSHAWPVQPNGVEGASVCANTGALPGGDTEGCPTRFEYFIAGTVPQAKAFRRDIQVFNDTGAPANAEALPEQTHTENHLLVTDPLDTLICLDCSAPMPNVTINYSEN